MCAVPQKRFSGRDIIGIDPLFASKNRRQLGVTQGLSTKMGIPAAEFGAKLCYVHYKQRVGYSELLWFKMEPSEDFLPQTSECLGFLDVVFPNVLPFFLGRQTFCSGKSD